MTDLTSIKQALATFDAVIGTEAALPSGAEHMITDEQISRAEMKLSEVLAGYDYVMPLGGMRQVLEAAVGHTSALAERDARIAELEAALKSARYYVEDAVIADGGIESCEIQHRAALEKIDASLTGQQKG